MERLIRFTPLFAAVVVTVVFSGTAAAQDEYQMPPKELAALVDAPTTPVMSVSPDRSRMALMYRPSLPSIAELAEPELRLAGIRINPRTNGPSRSRSYDRIGLLSLDGNETPVTGLPDGGRIRNVAWSPDGRHLACTVDRPDRIDLFVIDASGGVANLLLGSVNDVAYGAPLAWTPDSRSLIVRTVVGDRGATPPPPLSPSGPVIQENKGETAPARTYQDLLSNAYDEELFTHHVNSQLVRASLDGSVDVLGESGLYFSAEPSPDGRFLLVERWHRPYSYLVPAYRFPRRIEVWDAAGKPVHVVADLPLAEGVPTAFGSVRTGVRSISWRADAPATLFWAEALDGGDARTEAEWRDQLFTLDAPFTMDPIPLVKLPLRFDEIYWGDDDLALVTESWWSTRTRRVYAVAPGWLERQPRVVFDVSSEDRYGDPGEPVTWLTPSGTRVLMTADDGASIFLVGRGASEEGNRPFLRKMNYETGKTTELFRSDEPFYESPVSVLEAGARLVVTRRESPSEPPNYYVRDLHDGTATALTRFPHPYPDLAGVQKESIQYNRSDGIPLSATLYLPAGYNTQRDGPLPAFVWAYPEEFKSADAAGQRSDSPYQFKYVSYWGAVPYVTQGFAVIDDASMPVVGEGEVEPNDTFREQLVANAQAAIDEGARRGVVDPNRVAIGGHSYGAFMTANLLAHSDLFRAGIARSGAYNRTLTPFGFQAEERLFWEAPEIYYNMSPFMHVDKIDEPILLIHGEADNNSGTFPLQSRRYFSALKGLGKTARLVVLPHESHGYRARESVLHMLWETNRWLEMHVKNAPRRDDVTIEDPRG